MKQCKLFIHSTYLPTSKVTFILVNNDKVTSISIYLGLPMNLRLLLGFGALT